MSAFRRTIIALALVLSTGVSVYSQSVVDFGTDLYATKYYESMNAANPPAGEWYAVDYDDSSWNTYTNPLYFPEYDAFWVRRTFAIADNPEKHTFQLKFAHDDGARIYINGYLIHDHGGCCGRYNYIDVPSAYLVEGMNILAAYVRDNMGDRCLECFISSADGSDIVSDFPIEPMFLLSKSSTFLYHGVDGYSKDSIKARLITQTGFVDAQVSWTSSNQEVVAVSDGQITALSPGEAVVSASIVYEGVSYSKECSVEVRAITPDSKLVIVDQPGTLDSLLTDDEKVNTESLTVLGKLNGDDIHILRYMAGRDKDGNATSCLLADLDLYNVDFVSGYTYIRTTSNNDYIELNKGTLPARMFSECNVLKSIILPRNITRIGSSAFYDCKNLTSITIPNSVSSIDGYVFYGCSSLTSIEIPDVVTNIGEQSFIDCVSLDTVIINSPYVANNFFRIFRGELRGNTWEFYTKKETYPFELINPSVIVFPEGTTEICDNAFFGMTKLKSFSIPSTVKKIGGNSFSYCSSLSSIDIPENVSEMGRNAFRGCTNISQLTIESPVVADDFWTLFRDDWYYEFDEYGNKYAIWQRDIFRPKVIFPEGTTVICNDAFSGYNSMEFFKIPSTVTRIGSNAFYNCSSLKSIVIPSGVVDYGTNAFNNCTSLDTVIIESPTIADNFYTVMRGGGSVRPSVVVFPEGTSRIVEMAFYDLSGLKSFTIPSTVTTIGASAFQGAISLTSIDLPPSLETIGWGAFYCCNKLESINISNGVTSIGDRAFEGNSSLTLITLPPSLETIGSRAFYGCSKIDSINIPNGIQAILDYSFANCSRIKTINIPQSVTSIGNYAFSGCSSLSSIFFPDGLSSIGGGTFNYCSSLKKIVIPENVSEFGDNSFMDCTALDTVIIHSPAVADNFFNIFRGIDSYSYYGNSNYLNVKPSVVVFPEGTTKICDNAFRDMNNLKSFAIPSTVTEIGAYAFYCCSLLALNIPHSVNKIGNDALFDVYSIFESDTPATLVSESLLGELGVAVVPAESFEAYRQADYWHSFMAKIVRSDQLSRTVTANASETTSGLHIAVGEDNLNSVMNLTIKGSINGLDLLVIRNKMKNLRNLDLSEASIVANDNMFNYYEGGVIKADNELGARAFKDMTIRSIVLPNNLVAIGDNAFYNCTRLTSVYIADNVRTIGEGAFRGCSQLTDLHMSSNIREIKNFAFYGVKIDTIVFGDSLQIIGSNAFRDVSSLKVVSLGDGITTLSSDAFRGCSSLESLYLGRRLSTIGNGAFYDCRSLTNVIIPNSTKSIGSEAFRNCSMIDTLVIGHSVETIGSSAFYGCSNIGDVTFGKSIKEIGSYAFENCSNIQKISLPTSLKYIRQRAFANCTGLKEFRIPSSVLMIENEAFAGNRKLDAVYAYTIEPISIAQNTFSCWDFATLYVPKTSYYTYYLNTQWSQFMTLREFDEPYEYFYLNDDYLLDTITGRIDGVPDMLLNENSAIIVEGDETQEIAEIELMHNGTDGASIIGGKNDFTGKVENLTAKSMKVNIGVDGNRWYFFCFPFDVMHDSIECSAEYVIQTYDGAKRAEQGTGWVKLESDFTSLQKGQGYIFQTSRAGVLTIHVSAEYLTFTASNEKEILHTYASNDVSNASWNFIGNPFISYYDVQDLAKEYDAPIIVWNGKGYDVYKPGDDEYMLKPFETFFVQRIDGVQYVELLPENKLTYNQATTRSSLHASMRAAVGTPMNLDRQLVNIMIMGQDSVTDKTRIVYSVNASMDYEIGVDAAKFQADGVPQIYTLNGTTKYAINERPMGGDEIKLGYVAPKAGTYALSVPRHDADVEIYDNVTNSKVDFTFGDYTFQSKAGTYNDRFVIRKIGGVTAVKDGFMIGSLTVRTTEGQIHVSGLNGGEVEVYQTSGVKVETISTDGSYSFPAGVYVIKIGDRSVKSAVM